MRIGGIIFPSFNPYNKPTYEIYLSGCNRKCKGCHNNELANFNYGEELTDIDKFIKTNMLTKEAFFDIIAISGGDLLCQNQSDAFKFAFKLRYAFPNKEMWLFTGEDDWDNVPSWAKIIFNVIKYGSYKEDLKAIGTNSLLATTNQKLMRKGRDY